MSHFVL